MLHQDHHERVVWCLGPVEVIERRPNPLGQFLLDIQSILRSDAGTTNKLSRLFLDQSSCEVIEVTCMILVGHRCLLPAGEEAAWATTEGTEAGPKEAEALRGRQRRNPHAPPRCGRLNVGEWAVNSGQRVLRGRQPVTSIRNGRP